MRKIEHFTNRAGGKGMIHMEHLLDDAFKNDVIKLYAKVTIDVNSSIGIHLHEYDNETYYVVSGKGRYYDNGTYYEVSSNDVLFCNQGESHGIENIGNEPFVMIALIQKG